MQDVMSNGQEIVTLQEILKQREEAIKENNHKTAQLKRERDALRVEVNTEYDFITQSLIY